MCLVLRVKHFGFLDSNSLNVLSRFNIKLTFMAVLPVGGTQLVGMSRICSNQYTDLDICSGFP